MKIRINTRPTIKLSTLIIIMITMIVGLLLYMFSDSLPKPKTHSTMPAYDWQQEEEDLLLYQSQENKDSDIENKTDDDKYHDPTKPPEENMENIP